MGDIKGHNRRLDYGSYGLLAGFGLPRDHKGWTQGSLW